MLKLHKIFKKQTKQPQPLRLGQGELGIITRLGEVTGRPESGREHLTFPTVTQDRGFPGGPGVRNPSFQCRGQGFEHW